MHIVTVQSIEAAQWSTGSHAATYSRYRPNIVIDAPELEVGSEREWSRFRLGDLTIDYLKNTVRCEYLSQDPETGRDLKDVPVLALPHKKEFGIYASPILEVGEVAAIKIGDSLQIEEWAPQVA